jgi:hypothetical protein
MFALLMGVIGASGTAVSLDEVIGAPSIRAIAGALLCSVVGGYLLIAAIAIISDALLRALFPERIEREGELVRVRVRSRWGRRSDARLPRSIIRDVVLVPWQLGTQEVWVVVDGDRMFRVAEATSLQDAQRHAHAVAAAIHGREPLPRARVVKS